MLFILLYSRIGYTCYTKYLTKPTLWVFGIIMFIFTAFLGYYLLPWVATIITNLTFFIWTIWKTLTEWILILKSTRHESYVVPFVLTYAVVTWVFINLTLCYKANCIISKIELLQLNCIDLLHKLYLINWTNLRLSLIVYSQGTFHIHLIFFCFFVSIISRIYNLYEVVECTTLQDTIKYFNEGVRMCERNLDEERKDRILDNIFQAKLRREIQLEAATKGFPVVSLKAHNMLLENVSVNSFGQKNGFGCDCEMMTSRSADLKFIHKSRIAEAIFLKANCNPYPYIVGNKDWVRHVCENMHPSTVESWRQFTVNYNIHSPLFFSDFTKFILEEGIYLPNMADNLRIINKLTFYKDLPPSLTRLSLFETKGLLYTFMFEHRIAGQHIRLSQELLNPNAIMSNNLCMKDLCIKDYGIKL